MEDLIFKPLSIADKDTVQRYTYRANQRGCNFSFANLAAWAPMFHTSFACTAHALVLRFMLEGEAAYMFVAESQDRPALTALLRQLIAAAAPRRLVVMGVEDAMAEELRLILGSQLQVTPVRDRYDYVYRRDMLASLAGGKLKAKRNHANKFRSLYPDYEYRTLGPDLFAQCLALSEVWYRQSRYAEGEAPTEESIVAERQVMQFTFAHWEELGNVGGALLVQGRVVAFTYGGPITASTLDVCVEKADTSYEGAFAVINQEFCRHLPAQYVYVNREEDLGLPGLRYAKSSYHPEVLLTYNRLDVATAAPYLLERGNALRDKEDTLRWMTREYGFRSSEVAEWLDTLHINWPLSVRASVGDAVVGFLTMSDYRIEEEAEDMPMRQPALLQALNAYRYVAVFSFIVAEPYRGTALNHDMWCHIAEELQGYDFVFVPVLHRLRTHRYWMRRDARLFYEDSACKYYLIPNRPEVSQTLERFGL